MTADDIKALVERLHAAAPLAANRHILTEAAEALETLTLENQRLRVDAERYRMIRNRSDYWRRQRRSAVMLGMFEEFLDAVIDAARAQIDKEKPL